MKIDIQKLLDDLGISYSSTGKHARPGWINTECPFCTGNPGTHLGFNIAKGYCNCWRCGWKPLDDTLILMTGQNRAQISQLIRQYVGYRAGEDRKPDELFAPSELKFPSGVGPVQEIHTKYLESRDYDVDQLVREWDLQGTGPYAMSETGADYKFRIIAPIHLQNKLVSYQARDVTDKSVEKYKACPVVEEVIHHKHTLYGMDKTAPDRVLVLEGITDVWRIGAGSVATFGIEYTREQVSLLDRFRQVFIMFDPEDQAQEKAEELSWQLWSPEVLILDYGDPADLNSDDAINIRKDLRI
jgi:hypothetical protein